MNVIDLIAPTLPALLKTLDGRTTEPRRASRCTLAGAQIVDVEARLLHALPLDADRPEHRRRCSSSPGIAGLGFELFHPGVVIPGAFGAICMVCALFGFSVLPLSWAGLILVLLGVALLVVDAHVTTHGALTLVGPRRDRDRPRHALPQGAGAVPHVVPLVVTADGAARRLLGVRDVEGGRGARRSPVRVGPQEIVGMEGVVRDGRLRVRPRRALARPRRREPLDAGRARPGRRTRRPDPRRA